jgi:uncharacterized protein
VSKPVTIVDTGPVVALINQRDNYHAWAKIQFDLLYDPVITCEAVLAESWFLLRHLPAGQHALLKLMQQGILVVSLSLTQELAAIIKLTQRYRNVPMSLADACLVRMAELHAESVLMTLDSDFSIYRKHGRQVIPLITI